jgi:predicted DNA-binding transcriptional regulator YafY
MDYRQRIDRLLRMITLIQADSTAPSGGGATSALRAGRGWTSKTLAAELGTTPRTVFRDLNHLREAGVPVMFDERTKRYAIAGPFFMPPVQLTLDESLSLLALCEHVAQRGQIPFLKPAARAAHKIQSQLPAELRSDLASRSANLMIRTAAAMEADGCEDVYDKMQIALAQRRMLRCKYEPVSNEGEGRRDAAQSSRDVEFDFAPYALFFCVRAWYVIGRRSDRKDLRCMKLSRFSKVQPGETKYDIPAKFSLEKYLGNAWRMMRGKDVQVELLFDKSFAETVSETHWHRTQEFETHADGSCTFTCTVSGLEEIVWWVLSMGPHCKVIKPAALAQRVKELAGATARLYEKQS